ncbi:hypothetical protein [Bacillus marinisedimentorum]|nr:hypothetical protein [Bacillus marinisedimentorum]
MWIWYAEVSMFLMTGKIGPGYAISIAEGRFLKTPAFFIKTNI